MIMDLPDQLVEPDKCGINTGQKIANWGGLGTFADLLGSDTMKNIFMTIVPIVKVAKDIKFADLVDKYKWIPDFVRGELVALDQRIAQSQAVQWADIFTTLDQANGVIMGTGSMVDARSGAAVTSSNYADTLIGKGELRSEAKCYA